MPQTINIAGYQREVATEEELLAFANSIRQAGGADVLEALLPSVPGNTERCLIANALNFGCKVAIKAGAGIVRSHSPESLFPSGAERWVMILPENLTDDQREALGRVEGVELHDTIVGAGKPCAWRVHYLDLPETIGNAASAFDYQVAFQNLSVRDI